MKHVSDRKQWRPHACPCPLSTRHTQPRTEAFYYFYLVTRELPPGYAITVWRSDGDIYPHGRFYLDGQPRRQAISFQAYCRALSASHAGCRT